MCIGIKNHLICERERERGREREREREGEGGREREGERERERLTKHYAFANSIVRVERTKNELPP